MPVQRSFVDVIEWVIHVIEIGYLNDYGDYRPNPFYWSVVLNNRVVVDRLRIEAAADQYYFRNSQLIYVEYPSKYALRVTDRYHSE